MQSERAVRGDEEAVARRRTLHQDTDQPLHLRRSEVPQESAQHLCLPRVNSEARIFSRWPECSTLCDQRDYHNRRGLRKN